MHPKITPQRTARYLSLVAAFILAALPFHAVATTWLGSNVGHLDLVRIWKEILLILMVPPTLFLVWRSRELTDWFKKDWVVKLFILYIVLHLALGAWALARGEVNKTAYVYALIINLRFILFFLVCTVIATYDGLLKKYALKLLLWPAGVVLAFGLVQKLLLPYDFLKHLGYSSKTIPAYQTVDSNIDYRRIQSTLRGANPLGAYLVLTTTAAVVKLKTKSILKPLFILASLFVLFFSYSRSAWIGVALSFGFLAYVGTRRQRSHIVYLALSGVVLLAGGLYALHNNQGVQDTFLHTSNSSAVSTTSNSVRLTAIKNGARDVIHQPLGRGPGTAGPASVRNDHAPRIAENYYLQLGQEVGLEGLAIFLAINFIVLVRLWRVRADSLPRILLASWIGISFINLLSHAWSDDTLSLLWWGLAGIMLAPVILGVKNKRNETKAQKA